MSGITRKFAFCAALAIGGAGIAGEVYTNNRQKTALSEDYGRAAQCAQKQELKQSCTDQEQKSVAVKAANESNKKISGSVITTGIVIGIISVL